jgi:hypothetical protein
MPKEADKMRLFFGEQGLIARLGVLKFTGKREKAIQIFQFTDLGARGDGKSDQDPGDGGVNTREEKRQPNAQKTDRGEKAGFANP